jgi:hypothetical protein
MCPVKKVNLHAIFRQSAIHKKSLYPPLSHSRYPHCSGRYPFFIGIRKQEPASRNFLTIQGDLWVYFSEIIWIFFFIVNFHSQCYLSDVIVKHGSRFDIVRAKKNR